MRNFFQILCETITDLANGADTEADQVTLRPGRIALKIPVQIALALRDAQLIIGQRKMIHADVDITRARQRADGIAEDRKLDRGRWQIGFQDAPLRLEQRRQVRVAVEGYPVRAQVHDLPQGLRHGFEALFGQSVDKVDVDGSEPRGAGRRERARARFERLDAIHRLLHRRIEVLDAETHTLEAKFTQSMDGVGRDRARIDLDRAREL